MTHLMHLGSSNALVAALLAVAAAAVTWRGRCRPALAYGLWLLVLLKLVTPPLVAVPLGWPEPAAEPVVELACPAKNTGPAVEAVIPSEAGQVVAESPTDWTKVFAGAWLAGSLAFAALAAWRIGRLARWLRTLADSPPAWQARVDRLSERIGLRRPPRVLVSRHGAVPPLVVGLAGRPVMVFPSALWERLEDDQRDAVLLHELAHLRRGDHRLRLLELAALTIYWWFPVAWWASRRLRQAEEECCDTWVTWAAPDARPAYAAALVETVAFLSGQPHSLPIGASGAGPVVAMKRRLSMILSEETPRGLSRPGWVLILGALALMPLMPTLARSEPKPTREPQMIDGVLSAKACVQCHAEPKPKASAPITEDLHAKIIDLMSSLKAQRIRAAKTEQELKEALAKFEKGQGDSKEDKAERLEREMKRLREEVERLRRELDEKRERMGKVEATTPTRNIHYIRAKRFPIPFQQAKPGGKSLSLFVRGNTGKGWDLVERSEAASGSFLFEAPGDGRYDFSVRVNERRDRLDFKADPVVTVIVDTVRPVIAAELRDLGNDAILLNWSIADAHPDLSTLRADYRLEGEKEWRKLAVTPALEAAYHAKFADAGKVVEVRLRMRDKAGNEGEMIVKR